MGAVFGVIVLAGIVSMLLGLKRGHGRAMVEDSITDQLSGSL
jgi:hypothetical protein